MKVNEMVEELVVKELVKELDLPAMVSEIRPQIEKELRTTFVRTMVEVLSDGELLYELIQESFDNRVYDAMRKHMSSVFVSAIKAQGKK